MADNHSGGDTGRPRHAQPWWMDEPDSMEDTHSFRRDELHGDPTELQRARHAAPRRGLSDSAIHASEEAERTRPPAEPGPGPAPDHPEADADPPTPTSSGRHFSGLFSTPRPTDSGTRDQLSSSASDAARIRRAASQDFEDRSASAANPSGTRRSADSPDDAYSIYRRPAPASHSVSRTQAGRHSADTPDRVTDSPRSGPRSAASEKAPEADGRRSSRRRRPGTAAAASVAGTTAAASIAGSEAGATATGSKAAASTARARTTSAATPVDGSAAESTGTVMRGAAAGGGSRRSGREKARRSERSNAFHEGRYAALDADTEQGAEEQKLRSEPGRPRRGAFRRASMWTVLAAIIPGLGLMHSRVHRHRRLGLILVGLVLVAVTAFTIEAVTSPATIASIAVRPRLLRLISWTMPVGAAILVGLLVFTHIDIRPRRITRAQRWISSLLVGTLSLLIAAPLTVGARYANDEAAALSSIFKDRRSGTRPSIDTNRSVEEIWRDKPRVNVLLVGGDDSGSRNYRKQGEMNTDTMMVASINTQTGDTSIIQIPRNTANIPFPKKSKLHQIYPDGFSNGHGDDSNFFANALWTTVENEHKDAMGATDYPGADALKLGVGEALGLEIDYFMMLDIDGLQKFIEAIGGVTVNVNERLPIAGNTEGKAPTGYIEVGANQHLSGYNAMWYARSRSESTDYDRMGRQSCLIKAVLDQVSPQIVLTKFEAIASASGEMVVSDIPEGMLPAFVALALKIRNGNINRLLFTQGRNGFEPYDPDYGLIRKQVKETIASSGNKANKNKPVTSASPKATAKKTATAAPTTSAPTPSASASASSSAVSQSVTDVCAYHPVTQQR